jgi:hypothetical protein
MKGHYHAILRAIAQPGPTIFLYSLSACFLIAGGILLAYNLGWIPLHLPPLHLYVP